MFKCCVRESTFNIYKCLHSTWSWSELEIRCQIVVRESTIYIVEHLHNDSAETKNEQFSSIAIFTVPQINGACITSSLNSWHMLVSYSNDEFRGEQI